MLERYKQYREEREAAKRNPDQSKAKKPGDDKKKKLEDVEKKKPTVTPEKVYFRSSS